MQTQIACRCVIEEETEELGEKPLCHPPSGNRSTRQSVGIHGLARDSPSLIYPMYLTLQAPTPTRLLGTVSCLALQIPQSTRLHPPSLMASFGNSPKLPKL